MNESESGSIYRIHAKIDLDALRYNIEGIKRCKSDQTKLLGVLKADAYGHGAKMIAHELEDLGVEWLGVATVEEGIELRRDGVQLPILVLGYTCEAQYPESLYWKITPTIDSLEMAESFNAAAADADCIADIHIKIDTGMGRIGFLPNRKSLDDIEKISHLDHIRIQGMFTHFACADMEDKTHVEKQIQTFKDMIAQIRERNIHISLYHCANSASIMEMSQVHMNMVRAGIILYGLYPSHEMKEENLPLKPVMSIHSHVVHVKELPAGMTIGYGATYVTEKKTKIATIPVGYADGYPRALSNKGCVLIHGKRAPIIGRICMDQFMVDVSDISDVKIDDPVVLIGQDGDEVLSVEEVSELADSFNYEFICDVSRRVPRVYYENGRLKKIVNYLREK